jgi:hypothetical protein
MIQVNDGVIHDARNKAEGQVLFQPRTFSQTSRLNIRFLNEETIWASFKGKLQ